MGSEGWSGSSQVQVGPFLPVKADVPPQDWASTLTHSKGQQVLKTTTHIFCTFSLPMSSEKVGFFNLKAVSQNSEFFIFIIITIIIVVFAAAAAV